MPSFRTKMVSGLFKVFGVNKMLDKEGEDFQKLLDEANGEDQRRS